MALSNVRVTIPQLYYDIIARIIPGIALIISILITLFEPHDLIEIALKTQANKLGAGTGSILLLLTLVVAYYLSILIRGIYEGFLNPLKKCIVFIWKKTWIFLNVYKKTNNTPLENNNSDITESEMYDEIRKEIPESASFIVKLRAECHMLRNLYTGWGLLVIFNLSNVTIQSDSKKYHLIVMVLFLLFTWSTLSYRKHLRRQVKTSIKNHWNLLKNKKIEKK